MQIGALGFVVGNYVYCAQYGGGVIIDFDSRGVTVKFINGARQKFEPEKDGEYPLFFRSRASPTLSELASTVWSV